MKKHRLTHIALFTATISIAISASSVARANHHKHPLATALLGFESAALVTDLLSQQREELARSIERLAKLNTATSIGNDRIHEVLEERRIELAWIDRRLEDAYRAEDEAIMHLDEVRSEQAEAASGASVVAPSGKTWPRGGRVRE